LAPLVSDFLQSPCVDFSTGAYVLSIRFTFFKYFEWVYQRRIEDQRKQKLAVAKAEFRLHMYMGMSTVIQRQE
jgi:hypothetical protein